jgi:cytochrome c oxidase assembly factor CtaG
MTGFSPAALLAGFACLYLLGAAALWRRAGMGRGIAPWRAASFAGGWFALAGAALSPMHELGERLFSAHMIEHAILMLVAAPLIAVSQPALASLWALPEGARRRIGRLAHSTRLARMSRWATDPLSATIIHGAVLWTWHLPGLFALAVADEGLHWLQHATFFGSALLFWWALIGSRPRADGYGAATLFLFVTALHTGVLGALLVLARQPWYPADSETLRHFGLTALEDQQLGGLVMWVPCGVIYTGAALALAGFWITRSARLHARENDRAAVVR